MKKSILALPVMALSLATLSTSQAQTLTQFTFETSQPAGTVTAGTTFGPLASEGGLLSAQAFGFHATGTTYSSPSGASSSARSFSSTAWSVGDFYQVTLPNTSTFTGLNISFAAMSSNTGPGSFTLQYSTDGSTYTTFASYSVTATFAVKTFDFTGITAVENSANPVSFRLVDASTVSANGGTVAPAGTSRIDNFVVAVPEPSTYAMIGGGLGLLLLGQRARRRTVRA